MIGGEEASPVHVDRLHPGGGRQGQVYSKVTDQNCRTSKHIIYGACRIAIEGVHKQWKLTE